VDEGVLGGGWANYQEVLQGFLGEENSKEDLTNELKILQHLIIQIKLLLHGSYTCIYRRRVGGEAYGRSFNKPSIRSKLSLTLASSTHFLTLHSASITCHKLHG